MAHPLTEVYCIDNIRHRYIFINTRSNSNSQVMNVPEPHYGTIIHGRRHLRGEFAYQWNY